MSFSNPHYSEPSLDTPTVVAASVNSAGLPSDASDTLAAVFEATLAGMVRHDLCNDTATYSERWRALIGLDPGDPLDESPLAWLSRCHPDDHGAAISVWNEHTEFGWPVHETWRMAHKAGGYRWILVRSVLRWAADGSPGCTISLFSDVTEEHDAAVRHRALIEAIPDTVIRVDSGGDVLDVRLGANCNERRLFESVEVGQSLAPKCAAADRVAALMAEALENNDTVQTEWEWDTGDGRHYFEIRATAGEHEAVCVIRDVTGVKVMEQQRLQSQKLESIGQLAAGVAHEINTPLQFIGDNARFLQRSFDHMNKYTAACESTIGTHLDEDAAADLAKLRKRLRLDFIVEKGGDAVQSCITGVEQVAGIVAAMKEFSHPGSDKPVLADFNHALQSTLKVAKHEWKHVATVDWDLDPELPKVCCYGGEVNQTFLNVVVNAAQAMGDKFGATQEGRIGISTSHRKGVVEVRISDNGPGIPARVLDRIFDPFLTTKEVGKGTGQGLALARRTVVGKHGGEMRCESEVGTGTVFIIRLPIDFAGSGDNHSGGSDDGTIAADGRGK